MALSELKGSKIVGKLWTPLHEVESSALDQVRNICSMPWVYHAAFMPDIHIGKGACVGAVIGMKGAISPAITGVDLGCGMCAVKTNLKASDLPDDLKLIRSQIERDIPVGFNSHKDTSRNFVKNYESLWSEFKNLDSRVQKLFDRAQVQLGTLGGGNHFIELCLDSGEKCSSCDGTGCCCYGDNDCRAGDCYACEGEGGDEPNVWLMLHSGSRNIGKELAEIHISIARELVHNIKLPDRDLGVFLSGTEEMNNYRRDLFWAQKYAMFNREVMLELYKNALKRFFPYIALEEPIQCHHNYVSEETHFGEELLVTRKGAISAQKGQLGIIPGSMGTKSYIVRGLGNPESLNSASHGAGRRMSRGKAKKNFTIEDLKSQTAGVECRKDESVLDEIPGAYKPIEQVMAYQSDLVEIVACLKQILCVKG